MKRKLKKEVRLLIILMLIILITILLATYIFTQKTIGEDDTLNNNLNTNVNENISKKEEDDVIRVIIDEPQNEENNSNQQDENVNQNNNENNSDTENKNNTENKDDTVNNKKETYYIKINNKANVVTVYKKDSKGKYTVPVKAMLCSVGTATPTSGVYKTSDKYKWRLLQGNVYGQYAVRITGHILFHSVPYEKQAKDTLEWWEYDKLGTDASLGCVRLTVEDAKWIYDNCAKGTQVEFYSSSNPGPLGKPVAKKISSYDQSLKNWDPTDPDSKNPWNTYVETSTEPEISQKEEVTTSDKPLNVENNTNTVDTNNALNNV